VRNGARSKPRSKLKTECRAMTSEEQAAFDQLKTDFTAVSESIRKAEADMAALDSLLSADHGDTEAPAEEAPADPAAEGGMNSHRRPGRHDRDHRPRANTVGGEQLRRDRRLAFQAWARKQHGRPLTREHQEACKRVGLDPRAKYFEVRVGGDGSILKRALSTTVTAGGYTIAQDFSGALESALLDYSNVRGVCDEFTTDSGATMPYPTEDDTGNTGEQLGESTEAAFDDTTFSVVNFSAYKFSSKGILISSELLNDSEFNLEQFLGTQIGIRIGRIQGQRFTTGTGSSQPKGIVACASAGPTTAGATAITPEELTRLAFSVDRAYRGAPKCGYMMHDSVYAYCLLLKDGENRPLLRDSYRDGIMIPLLNGFPVYTNQFMQAVTTATGLPVTATKSVLFGDFSKFKIRDVGSIRVRRLDERYAEKDQVGFIGFMRSDSNCVNTAAIKYLLQA
jgi:HK97 family phage major capsid protein